MIDFTDTSPDTAVRTEEYQRLLGYPPRRQLDERARELAGSARAWYDAYGRPWVRARQARAFDLLDGDGIVIDGVRFTSARLHRTLRDAGADGVVLVAVSAGPELEQEAQRLWRQEKPDEYFFLEVYGSAVVEHLVTMTGARLCGIAEADGRAVLPHYSPGYPEWEITEQAALLELTGGGCEPLPGALDVLESGMLRPKKSLLAVFGLTRHTERVRPLTDLIPCESCTLRGCHYRRAPYRGPRHPSEVERLAGAVQLVGAGEASATDAPGGDDSADPPAAPPLELDARYSTNIRALRRWAEDRLSLEQNPDGTTDALFRYEGSTCSNMGRPFRFDYTVRLAPREEHYRVLAQQCAPAPGDEGHTFMCRYRTSGPKLLATIARDRPLVGHPLDHVLDWHRAPVGPGCYCEGEGRKHKWGLVLETIHYALAQREKRLTSTPRPREVQAT